MQVGEEPIEDPVRGIAPDRVPWAAAQVEFSRRFANEGLYASDERYIARPRLLMGPEAE